VEGEVEDVSKEKDETQIDSESGKKSGHDTDRLVLLLVFLYSLSEICYRLFRVLPHVAEKRNKCNRGKTEKREGREREREKQRGTDEIVLW
jgi:hypothetical protein